MTEQEVKDWKKKIDAMSQTEMARLWRFAPVGHPLFVVDSELYKYFVAKFKGFTPEISKAIGW